LQLGQQVHQQGFSAADAQRLDDVEDLHVAGEIVNPP
jgi:hypothetical protein